MGYNGHELRQAFLEFFEHDAKLPHRLVAPAPLIPPDDPTLLFTSAGMVQFKNFYSGAVDPLPYTRATTCQPCLRAGGKGSDLENVGKTLRHHTLFEMLGNFSFGDYFKREAIALAWRFITEKMNLPKERLFPTIFQNDDEAEKLWSEETDCPNPVVRLDAKENFWGPAGETGACGPCSEIKFFMGSDEELAEARELFNQGDKGMATLAHRIVEEGDMFLEIWNMVFPQFDQQRDGSRPILKNRGIDTGAGLERMTTAMLAMEGKAWTPYETDLLQPIVQAAAGLLGVTYRKVLDDKSTEASEVRHAINAISDHIRALVFCLAEGITPGNVGRGYVVRRIQRRALRFASLLGRDQAFMPELVDPVIDTMGDAYPHLKKNVDFIKKALRIEEESFLRTRNRGMKLLDELLLNAKQTDARVITGEEAFKLWDTYGFPLDLTREIAEDEGVAIDMPGYERALREQKERGRASWQGAELDKEMRLAELIYEKSGASVFRGYDSCEVEETAVVALIRNGEFVEELGAGDQATVVLAETPFYAEAGGQIGDTGRLEGGAETLFEVHDTQKSAQGVYLHRGELQNGQLRVGDKLHARVDEARRMAIRRNHSSTHLLQAALKKFVGGHTTQAGSFVGPESLRFDFSHPEPVRPATLRQIQEQVNEWILQDLPVTTEVLPLEEARKRGAIAPFGEKYGPTVRVVQMGAGDSKCSLEFCGGTHLSRTGQAARFRIISEGSIAAGVRRIEAVTGEAAARIEAQEQYDVVQPIQATLAAKGEAVVDRVHQLSQRIKELEKELARQRQKLAVSNIDQYIAGAQSIGDAKVATALIEGMGANELRTLATSMQEKLGSNGVAIAVSQENGKVSIVASVGEAARAKFPAGKVVNAIAGPLGGKGGGKPDIAQAGAKDAGNVKETLARATELLSAI